MGLRAEAGQEEPQVLVMELSSVLLLCSQLCQEVRSFSVNLHVITAALLHAEARVLTLSSLP